MDEIKRTTGPQTSNGRRWEMQLNAEPAREWLALFRASGESLARTRPDRIEFDRASVAFRSGEDEVEHWIESIDGWIAAANAKHALVLERVWRERLDRADAETKEDDRIQRMNDRFKNL